MKRMGIRKASIRKYFVSISHRYAQSAYVRNRSFAAIPDYGRPNYPFSPRKLISRLFPAKKFLDVIHRELHPRRPAVVALPRMRRDLHRRSEEHTSELQ